MAIGNLSHLTRTLDRSAAAWGGATRKSIWITEYGYQTTPPDPVAGVPPARHGPLYAWGEELAYRDPRVASIAQFLLLDDRPVEGFFGTDPRRWVTWQSGLFDAEDRRKPFERDYRLPLHLTQGPRSVRRLRGVSRRAARERRAARRGARPAARRGGPARAGRRARGGRCARCGCAIRAATSRPTSATSEPVALRVVWLDPVSRRLVTSRTALVR